MPDDLTQTLREIGKAADDLKAKHAETEKLADRIGDLEVALDRLGTGKARGPGGYSTEAREHADAFKHWLRNPKSNEARSHLDSFEKKVASGLTDGAGGALVPEILVDQILRQAKNLTAMRQHALVVPVSSGDVKFPVSTNAADSAWVGETGTRSATTEPTILERKPTVGTVYSYISASEELIFDSAFPIDTWFSQAIADELANAEGTAFISGNGTNRPTGILNTAPESAGDDDSPARTSTAIQYLPTGAAGAFVTLSTGSPVASPMDVFATTAYSLKAQYRGDAVWMMSSSTAAVVSNLKDGDGRSFWRESAREGESPMLLGFPVVLDEAVPAIAANSHSILFGNFRRAYGIFDVGPMRVTVDDNLTTPGRVKYYFRKRVGGIVLDHNAAKAIKFAAS